MRGIERVLQARDHRPPPPLSSPSQWPRRAMVLFLEDSLNAPHTYQARARKLFKKQIDVFVDTGMDFLLCEYFEHAEEMEWAIEECKKTKLPVAANMCIGPDGDLHGVSAAECAIRMARAGADIVGVNCHFDPFVSLEALKKMKAGLDAAGLHPYLMCQPLAYHTPDAGKQGFIDLPEFPS